MQGPTVTMESVIKLQTFRFQVVPMALHCAVSDITARIAEPDHKAADRIAVDAGNAFRGTNTRPFRQEIENRKLPVAT